MMTSFRFLDVHCFLKKRLCQILTDFLKSFTDTYSRKNGNKVIIIIK